MEQIKLQIDELEKFKSQIESQQVSSPLDSISKNVITKNLMVPTGKITYPSDVISYGSDAIEFLLNGKRYLIKAK